jgi:predicted site-specific integrase-resolvase
MKNGHTKVFAGPKQICKKYRVQPITLRRLADRGKIEYTVTPTGRYLYNISQVEQAFGQEYTQRERICYARVSSQKQKEDLQRQVDEFKQQYPNHTHPRYWECSQLRKTRIQESRGQNLFRNCPASGHHVQRPTL